MSATLPLSSRNVGNQNQPIPQTHSRIKTSIASGSAAVIETAALASLAPWGLSLAKFTYNLGRWPVGILGAVMAQQFFNSYGRGNDHKTAFQESLKYPAILWKWATTKLFKIHPHTNTTQGNRSFSFNSVTNSVKMAWSLTKEIQDRFFLYAEKVQGNRKAIAFGVVVGSLHMLYNYVSTDPTIAPPIPTAPLEILFSWITPNYYSYELAASAANIASLLIGPKQNNP